MVFDIQHVFPRLQNADTGFDITGIQTANGPLLAAVTVGGIVLAVLFWFLARRVPADSPVKLGGLFRAIPLLAVALAAVGVAVFMIGAFTSGEALEADDYVDYGAAVGGRCRRRVAGYPPRLGEKEGLIAFMAENPSR